MVALFPPPVLLPVFLLLPPSDQPAIHPSDRPSLNGPPLCFAHMQTRSHKQVPEGRGPTWLLDYLPLMPPASPEPPL